MTLQQVFERGVEAIPLSVDLWIHYLGFIKAVQGEGTEGTETIRRLTLSYTEYYIPLSFMTLKSLPSVLGSPKVEQNVSVQREPGIMELMLVHFMTLYGNLCFSRELRFARQVCKFCAHSLAASK